jgi:hypothetical protein
MEIDIGNVAEKLQGENQEYWIHLQASSSLDKYPGEYRVQQATDGELPILIHGSDSQTTRQRCGPKAFRHRRLDLSSR